jgi:hypothetical protein
VVLTFVVSGLEILEIVFLLTIYVAQLSFTIIALNVPLIL